jgi:mannose-6-phosphate isomerase-like protein (cupin superfamily)
MPTLIPHPTRIESAGNKPKVIEEYIGRVNTATGSISVAHMRSPEGWEEPGQTPEFDEYTLVLRGTLRVHHKSGEMDVAAGQAVIGPLFNPIFGRRRIHRSLPAGVLT